MKLTLDSESQRFLDINRAFLHAPDDQLPGIVHDAWLTGLLSRGTAEVVCAETAAVVSLDGMAVELETADRRMGDPRGAALKQATRLSSLMGLAEERMPALHLAAIRVGFRRMVTPDMVEWVERMQARDAQKAVAT